jgi:hypothetical protein
MVIEKTTAGFHVESLSMEDLNHQQSSAPPGMAVDDPKRHDRFGIFGHHCHGTFRPNSQQPSIPFGTIVKH